MNSRSTSNSWWEWAIFPVMTGGAGSGLPGPPAPLTGLGTINSVPEPSTAALLGLGFAVLFIRQMAVYFYFTSSDRSRTDGDNS